jgi:diacylglycerol kinase family enzyme
MGDAKIVQLRVRDDPRRAATGAGRWRAGCRIEAAAIAAKVPHHNFSRQGAPNLSAAVFYQSRKDRAKMQSKTDIVLEQSDIGPGVKVSVVLNRAAGALLENSAAHESLADLLRQAGFEADFVPVELGALPERMAAACNSGASLVVVGGGDGTIACAAETAAAAGVTLGILPFGTMNVLARDLGIPIGDPAAAVALLRDGEAREIDAAEVNGRLYLCNSMIGLPARLARFREAARGKGLAVRLWLRFVHAALRAASLMVSVNALDDSSGRLFGRSRLDGGALVLYLARHLTLWDMLRLAFRAMTGHLRDDPALDETHANEIEIIRIGRRPRRTIRVMNDGEVMLVAPPLSYKIRPGALRVMAPRRPDV